MVDAASEVQLKGLWLLQERYGDPILTGPTVLLLVMMFVIAPLPAADVIVFEAFGLIVALAMVFGVLVMSRSPVAFVLITAAVVMNAAGAVLLYLLIALFFVAAFAFVGLLIPTFFQGIKIEDFDGARQQPDLFQLRHADFDRLRRRAASPPDRAQPVQRRDDHRPALPGDAARPAGDPGARGTEIALPGGLLRRVVAAGRRRLPVVPDPAAPGAAAEHRGERDHAGKNCQPFQHRETSDERDYRERQNH